MSLILQNLMMYCVVISSDNSCLLSINTKQMH